MDTATPVQEKTAPAENAEAQQENAAALQENAKRLKETRLVRFFVRRFKPELENSKMLPTDKWALKTLSDFAKTNTSFKNTVPPMAGSALGAVATVAVGVVTAFLVTGVAAVAGVALATMAVAGGFGALTHKFLKKFKSETAPQLQADFGKKYLLAYPLGDVRNAWQKNREALAAKKAAEKAKKAETPAPAAVAPEVKAVVVEEKKPETVQMPVTNTITAPVPDAPKVEKKKTVAGTVGSWILKKALDEAAKRVLTAPPANDTAAKTEDTAPKKKDAPPPPKAA